ncbi:enoyl-CoA hydratase/isomerase family protein [Kitasatospora sp. NPDC054939]
MNVSSQAAPFAWSGQHPSYVPPLPVPPAPQPAPVAEPLPAVPPSAPARSVRADLRGPVLHVELDTPANGNSVTTAVLDELLAVLCTLGPEVRAVVLSGAGRDFCLGGDRDEFAASLDRDPTGGGIRSYGHKARQVCDALTNSPAVTIARVQGRAVGAGFALALACDLRVGAQNASFRLPELTLGLPVAWGGLLPRLLNEVGTARTREIILTGRPVGAVEAGELSILQRVVPEAELDGAVAEWTRPVTRRPEAALRVTKTLLNSHAAAHRMADSSLLDGELMASVLAAAHYGRTLHGG